VTFPAAWTPGTVVRGRWAAEHLDKKGQTEASMVVRVEERASHAEALARLGAVEAEYPGAVKYLLIGGWPALERSVSVKFERPGDGPGATGVGETSLQTTTAIAVQSLLVRLDTRLQPTAPPALAEEALAIGRRVKLPAGPSGAAEEVRGLQAGKYRLAPAARPRLYAPTRGGAPARRGVRRPPLGPGGAGASISGTGEIEAVVSGNGSTLLTDASCAISVSTDFGASFTTSTVKRGTLSLDGDCSVAWGQSGTFYLSQLGGVANIFGGIYTIAAFSSTDGATRSTRSASS
jgi:hypothetical protein